jgi:hypothetical protein
MSRDFQSWDNRPLHSTPPDVARVLHADDLRRERRWRLLKLALIFIVGAATIWWVLHQ